VALIALATRVEASSWSPMGSELSGMHVGEAFGYGVSLNGNGTIMAVGAPETDEYGKFDQGRVQVYRFDTTSSTWTEMGAAIVGTDDYQRLGQALSLSADGTRLTMSASIYFWQASTNTWDYIAYLSNCLACMFSTMSADGSRFALGKDDRVHIFSSSTLNEVSVQYLSPGTGRAWYTAPAGKSMSLSADGTRLAIGGKIGNSNGFVRVFHDSDGWGTWVQIGGDIDTESGEHYPSFGNALDLSADGNRLIVGAPGVVEPSGYAYTGGSLDPGDGAEPYAVVYEYDAGTDTWGKMGGLLTIGQAKATFGSEGYGSYYHFVGKGVSISDDGSMIAVGVDARKDTNTPPAHGPGFVRLYTWKKENDSSQYDWVKLTDDFEGNSTADAAGKDVSLSGDGKVVAVGKSHFTYGASTTDPGYVAVYGELVASPAAPSPAAGAPNSVAASCSSSGDSRATGGTVTTVGEYTIHTFTSSGSFRVTDLTLTEMDVLVVGGGGGGGTVVGGGGGGGGVLYSAEWKRSSTTLFDVNVGAGGDAATDTGSGIVPATGGGESSFDDSGGGNTPMVAFGGYRGHDDGEYGTAHGGACGACLHGPWFCNGVNVSEAFNYHSSYTEKPGGFDSGMSRGGGGGAGAGQAALATTEGNGTAGGYGIQSDISGTATYYAGGGGGAHFSTSLMGAGGGLGGGGQGTGPNGVPGGDGLENSGGGGGGGGAGYPSGAGGKGGSGIVIVRYKTPTVCNECGTDYYYNGTLCISCPTGSSSPPGATTSCKCPANYHRRVDGGVYSCAACTQGATRPAGDTVPGGAATTCAGSSGSAPSSPTQGKEEKKKQAEKTRDSILGDITNTRLKAKAKLLADAAIAGVKVKRLKAKLTADSEDTACSDAFTKAGMSASDGACVATAASSGKRRSLSSTTYDVELMFSSSTVSDDALAAAELEMKNNGVEGVSSDTAVDPIAELKTVPGVDTSKLQTFETEASDAAEAAAESAAPPPAPPPPKPNLVLDDDDGAIHVRALTPALLATALALVALT